MLRTEAERMSLNMSPPIKLDPTINSEIVKHNLVSEATEASASWAFMDTGEGKVKIG